jgi:biotin carboxylase
MLAPPAVIVIGAGPLQVPLIRVAKDLHLHVIATDGDPAAPGLDYADEALVVSTYEAAATVERLTDAAYDSLYALKGVCTAGADVAPTVALVAEMFGLPGLPLRVATMTHNKMAVRSMLRGAGLHAYQPPFCIYDTCLRDAEQYAARIGYPLVVKPLEQRASRGVTFVEDAAGLEAAVTTAAWYSPLMLFERRLFGSEHSAEVLLRDGHLLWSNIVDRVFDYTSGIPIELGHINPTSLDTPTREAIQGMLLNCAGLLGVRWGAFKADVLVAADGPYVLEVTARLSGGWDCQGTSPLTHRHPLRQLVQLSCDMAVEATRKPIGVAACAAILPTAAMGTHLPAALPRSARRVEWAVAPGAPVPALAHNAARLGFVLTHASTAADAWTIVHDEALRLQGLLEAS